MKKNNTFSASLGAAVSEGPVRWLVVGGFLLIAAIAVGATLMAANFRTRALQNASRELENTVHVLARHFDQQLEDLEVVQKDLIDWMHANGVNTAGEYRRQMSTEVVHRMLLSKLSAQSYVGGVHLFDDEGRLINSSTAWPPLTVDVGDRPYFRAFKFDAQSPEMIVAPVNSRINGIWTTVIARKVSGPNGELIGVVSRGIPADHFSRFFATVALAPGASIAIHHNDGTLLARHPHLPEVIGKNFRKGLTAQIKVFEVPATATRLVSPLDGKDRLIASRTLASFPMVIVAGTTTEAVLADWREQTTMLVAIAGASVLTIGGLLLLVVRKLVQLHRRQKLRLTLEKQRLDTAVSHMTQGLLLFDASQRLVICNRRYIEMYGLSSDVVKPGCTFREVIAHRKETGSFTGNVEAYIDRVLHDLKLGKDMIIETPDGRSIQIVSQLLEDGGWVATHEDITERRQVEERITHLAHYDALTDLPNRTLFREKIKRELPHANTLRQLAVMYIDIDEFKTVNDSLGHLIGDELLKSLAQRLAGCLDKDGFVARLGGDEFAVVQTAVHRPGDVADLANRIHAAIRTPCDCLGHLVTADASIGIAMVPQDGFDLEQILKRADLAMYAAKAAGRRTHRFFEPVMEAQVRARRRLETDLRQALTNGGGFEICYQPCLDLRNDVITSCEALVRWRHPERGLISPADFVPTLEETGLINQLGEWVLRKACMEATTWPDHVRLAVNVSPVQFESGSLALKVIEALALSRLPANRLELEITEAVLIRDDDAALGILHQLRAIGVRIALDDFGTGYSSLSYLKRFPFDKIKIDRCFVADITEPDGSAGIVRAVVNIAGERNMTTTAEGVETAEQQRILRKLGCSEMQGYLFSAPRSADAIAGMMRTHRSRPAVVPESPREQRPARAS